MVPNTLPPDALAAALAAINLSTTIGPLLLGGLISAVLFGITSAQTVAYYQRNLEDRLLVKLVVFTLWLLDVFDMCLISHILWWYFVTNYANPVSLQNPVWSIILHVMVTSITQTIVRGMFAWRVYRLSYGNWIPTVFIATISMLDFVCGIVITVKAFHTTFLQLKNLDAVVYVEFVSGFAGDALVALCLCYFLHKSRTRVRRTENIINVLTAYIVSTGLLTAVTSSVSLTLFASQPNNLLYISVYLQLSKLYVNAYLAMLNARDSLRERSNDLVSLHLSRLSTSHVGPAFYGPDSSSPVIPFHKEDPIEVVVETQVHSSMDGSGHQDKGYPDTRTV